MKSRQNAVQGRSIRRNALLVAIVAVAVGGASFSLVEATRPYEGESWGAITATAAGGFGAAYALAPFLLAHFFFLWRRSPKVELSALSIGFLIGLEVSRLRGINPIDSFFYCFVGTLVLAAVAWFVPSSWKS